MGHGLNKKMVNGSENLRVLHLMGHGSKKHCIGTHWSMGQKTFDGSWVSKNIVVALTGQWVRKHSMGHGSQQQQIGGTHWSMGQKTSVFYI